MSITFKHSQLRQKSFIVLYQVCVLDSSPCDMFMVQNGNCLLGSVTAQNNLVDEIAMDDLVFEENSENHPKTLSCKLQMGQNHTDRNIHIA